MSNIGVTCQYFDGQIGGNNQLYWQRKVVATFTDNSYYTTNFHILLPDMPDGQHSTYYFYHIGIYNTLTKLYNFKYSARYYRAWNNWYTSLSNYAALLADIDGKAGSYKDNVTVTVYNPTISTGGTSFLFMSTQWSLF